MSSAGTENDTTETSIQEATLSGPSWGVSNQHGDGQIGENAREPASGGVNLNWEIPTDLQDTISIKLGPNYMTNWIAERYVYWNKASFFTDQFLELGLQQSIFSPQGKCFASQVEAPIRSVQGDEELTIMSWIGPPLFSQTFSLAPVSLTADGRESLISPSQGSRAKWMCIRVEAKQTRPWSTHESGLLGWSNHWHSSTQQTDILDAEAITLSRRGEYFVVADRVKRFEQKRGDPPRTAMPFSAWVGADREETRQRALLSQVPPNLKVGFVSVLLSRYEQTLHPARVS